MKSRTYIMLVLVAGLGLIVALFVFTPATAGGQIPGIITAIGVLVPVLAKLGETEAKVEQVAEKVDANTVVTETVKEQAASTHELVNGHMVEWRAALEKIAILEARIAEQAGERAGREEGRLIAIDLLAANAQAAPAQAPEHQDDGTVVVTAPVTIAVKAPEGAQGEAG